MFKKVIYKLLKNTELIKNRYVNFLYNYDRERFIKYSGLNEDNSEFIATKIRLFVHAIEKGMSLKNAREGFGRQKIEELIELFYKYKSFDNTQDKQVIELTRCLISKYIQHQRGKMDLSFIPEEFYDNCSIEAGALIISKEEYCKDSDFNQVALNRHSIRDFSPEPVRREDLISAVKLAQTAPSACNRQPVKVYVCDVKKKCEEIIKMHGGFNGFENISAILAVTGNLTMYQNEYERNTVFVDGGIFLMNLLYSLQYYKIANCPIIWGTEPYNDNILYKLLNIPKNEEIISLVATGYFPEEEAKSACSAKRDINDVIRFADN